MFLEFEPDPYRWLVLANYLVFVAMAVETIVIWIGYIIARWIISRPQITTDMSTLYKNPTADPIATPIYNACHTSRASTVKSITYLAKFLGFWFITRYGYHYSIFFFIQTTLRFAWLILILSNLIKPGKTNVLCIYKYHRMIIAGSIDEASVTQWYYTLMILTCVTAIPINWLLIALNPVSNTPEWVYLTIGTTALGIYLWSWCKYYLDTYVNLDKI